MRRLRSSMAALSNTPNGEIGSPAKIRKLSPVKPLLLRLPIHPSYKPSLGIPSTELTRLTRRPSDPPPAAQARVAATTTTAKPPLMEPSTAASASAPMIM